MPVLDQARKYYSDLVKGINTADNSNAMQFNFGTVEVTSAFTVDAIGIPVVYDTSASTYVIFTDATASELAAAITAGDAPMGVVGVLVGTGMGAGFNPADVDYTAGVSATSFFRGANNAGVAKDGIDYATAATSSANQTAFEAQLVAQGLMVVESAEVIDPTYTS